MGRSILAVHSAIRIFLLIIGLTAASSGVSYAITTTVQSSSDIADKLRHHLNQNDLSIPLYSKDLVNQFYTARDYNPAWLDSNQRVLPVSERLLDFIGAAAQDGLRPELYHQQRLSSLLEIVHVIKKPSPSQLIELELLLSDAFFSYTSHLAFGRLNPNRVNTDWTLPTRTLDLIGLLEQAVDSGDFEQTLLLTRPKHSGYRLLKSTLAHYRKIANNGGWSKISPGKTLRKDMNGERVEKLRTRLQASGDWVMNDEFTSSTENKDHIDASVFDKALEQAVMRFQSRHGLEVDGLVGRNTLAALNVSVDERISQIELNMERWRWLPEDLGKRHILVNIPGYELKLVENSKPVFHSKVVVGRTDRPTPIFTGSMSHLVISPYWNVPRTIAVKDKLPILRKNPYALKKQKIRVFNRSGREIDPGRINWYNVGRRNFKYRLRQDPGPKNALGDVKFMFPNRHSVYLHDTSSPELFERDQRAYSSGCVRVAKPVELAEYLLKSDSNWNRKTIEQAIKKGRQRTVMLNEEIPVHLMYWTVWQDDDGLIHFGQDIYRHDKTLIQALNSIDTQYVQR